MKWKTKRLGDKKTRKWFAFFPTKMEDGTTVWFELYHSEYQYSRNVYHRSKYGVPWSFVRYEWNWLRSFK